MNPTGPRFPLGVWTRMGTFLCVVLVAGALILAILFMIRFRIWPVYLH